VDSVFIVSLSIPQFSFIFLWLVLELNTLMLIVLFSFDQISRSDFSDLCVATDSRLYVMSFPLYLSLQILNGQVVEKRLFLFRLNLLLE